MMNIDSVPDTCVLFVDMNSFFATCEQQVNYWLRGRPIVVCVYTGKHGVIIAPSIEAKQKGIKLGMRLSEAIKICPELVPLETTPHLYRQIHVKVMNVFRKYTEHVIPKSIDEAVVDISNYKLIHKDPVVLAKKIKEDIRNEVGDWLKCSVGIAPNAFLAKLASNLQKPDGLVEITPTTIDSVLEKLKLTDLPGINTGMERRMNNAGIYTPLQLRYSSLEQLKRACQSIVGIHWYYRLHFKEVDHYTTSGYKSMQARRAISAETRRSLKALEDLLVGLCMKLEKRMVNDGVFCTDAGIFTTYENGTSWKDFSKLGRPVQDGGELLQIFRQRIADFEMAKGNVKVISTNMTSLGISVSGFINGDMVQYHLFEDNVSKNNLRKVVYDIKNKYGHDKIFRAMEMRDEGLLKDAIGFGSVKDLYPKE